jgi:uncharacterized membrane protein
MKLALLNLMHTCNKLLFMIGAMWCCGIFGLLLLGVVIAIVPAGCLLIRLTDWDSSIDKDIDRIKKRGSAI